MSSFLTSPFTSRPSRPTTQWAHVGALSSYPDTDDSTTLGSQRLCAGNYVPGCRIFHISREDGSKVREIAIDEWNDGEGGGGKKDQVMVFRYKGRVVGVDHECPHSSYPLSNGTPFDVEDFGVVLSTGISCPKHGWSFDVHTGRADRGSYKLGVWEVQQRGSEGDEGGVQVWVRRKQRIG